MRLDTLSFITSIKIRNNLHGINRPHPKFNINTSTATDHDQMKNQPFAPSASKQCAGLGSTNTKEQNTQVDSSRKKCLIASVVNLQLGNKIDCVALGAEAARRGKGGKHRNGKVRQMELDKIKLLLPGAVFLRLESPQQRLQTPLPV